MASGSDLEHSLYFELRRNGLRGWQAEYRFGGVLGNRKWRFDVAWPEQKVAVEVTGGLYTYGKHSRPAGRTNDARKAAEAQLQGWVLIEVTPPMIKDGSAVELVKAALERAA